MDVHGKKKSDILHDMVKVKLSLYLTKYHAMMTYKGKR